MRPFHIAIPQEAVDDLHRRLDATRWPSELPGVGWSRGTPLAYLKDLAGHWRHRFDWRRAEAGLNRYPQFITEIDGADVHFLHCRSAVPGATPVVITHGWPGSFVEFLEVIDRLTDPEAHGGDVADACHVVVPSIPGYGFSGPTRETGWDLDRVARAWAELMARLGYTRYVAQGGDWGMPISLKLGLADPAHVVGVHVNMFVTFPPEDDPFAFADLDGTDLARLEFTQSFASTGMGWQKIQSTRPQTLAYGLTDSPVGQLAWIVEKFREWTDGQVPEDAVDRELLLTIVSLYWFTATAGSSAQLYYESTPDDEAFAQAWGGPWPLSAPVGVAVFPQDAVRPVRRWAERVLPTLEQWTEFDHGGHFAALECPDELAGDLAKFIRSLPPG